MFGTDFLRELLRSCGFLIALETQGVTLGWN